MRGTQKLIYGPGVNAPWNSGTGLPGVAPTPQLVNGAKAKEKEKEKDAASAKPLPDAKMYATWSWEPKSYREPLPRRTRTGSVQLSSVVGNGRRARSESHG